MREDERGREQGKKLKGGRAPVRATTFQFYNREIFNKFTLLIFYRYGIGGGCREAACW